MTEDQIQKIAEGLIFEAASNAGFFLSLDDDDVPIYSAGEHGEVDPCPDHVALGHVVGRPAQHEGRDCAEPQQHEERYGDHDAKVRNARHSSPFP